MQNRVYIIDILRGLAIIGMVLSGQILWNAELPAWLFHAQVPPPNFVFDPTVPGITWVDLVFPFFLFSMGAAFPLAIIKRLEKGETFVGVLKSSLVRWFLLSLFAISLGNLRMGNLGDIAIWLKSIIQIIVWVLFCTMFIRFNKLSPKQNIIIHLIGAFLIIILMIVFKLFLNLPVSLHRCDIIIMVLANMALWGTLIWYFTRNNLLARLAILAIVIALKMTSKVDSSWNVEFWNWTPAAWLFRFDYLKYLAIIIPGSIVGDILCGYMKKSEEVWNKKIILGAVVGLVLLVLNMYCLFSRQLPSNMVFTLLLLSLLLFFLRSDNLLFKITSWGAFWLVLGLVFEAYEGGVKKDSATISYFFITSGLASVLVASGEVLIRKIKGRPRFLIMCGQNPMIAYTATGFIIMPFLNLTGLNEFLVSFAGLSPWCGVVRGIIITTIVVIITCLFTKKKIFWRT